MVGETRKHLENLWISKNFLFSLKRAETLDTFRTTPPFYETKFRLITAKSQEGEFVQLNNDFEVAFIAAERA